MSLRLENVTVDEDKKKDPDGAILQQGLIYIPFGKAVFLPATQLHDGHYSRPGNLRFYSIFADINWNSSNLQEFDSFLSE